MEFITGYALGLAVSLIVVLANHSPVTAYDIQKAEVACVDNKGLREISGDKFYCANGAVFEKGEGK